MSHQVQRIFTLYKALSRSPSQAKTVNELAINQNIIDAYDLNGTPTSTQSRQIRRDLIELEEALGLENDSLKVPSRTNANAYYLPPTATLDKTDDSSAMLLLLAESFLKKVAPKDLLANAQWLFDNASKQLEKNNHFKDWRKRIYFKPLQTEFAGLKAEDELKIYQALQHGSPLKITYHSQQHDEEREYRAFPVKIVVEPHCRLLILENPTYNDTMTFLFHRIRKVEIIEKVSDMPDRVKVDLDKIDKELPKHTESMFSYEPLDLVLQVAEGERYLIEDADAFANYEKSSQVLDDGDLEFTISNVLVSASILDYLVANSEAIYIDLPEDLHTRVVERLEGGLTRHGYFEE